MKKENVFLKNELIEDEFGDEWEICPDEKQDDSYEYKQIEIYDLKMHNFTFMSIQKFLENDIKTNIHFIYSKLTHNLAIDVLNGIDIWNNKIDINKLNAVIFLLFKPCGAGVNLPWKPSRYQLEAFSRHIFSAKTKFKVGMDSCLVNHVLKFHTPSEIERMSLDTCEGARMSAYISPDMDFMPCSFARKGTWSEKITNEHTIPLLWKHSLPFIFFRRMLENERDQCPLNL